MPNDLDISEAITYSTAFIKCAIAGERVSLGTGFFIDVHSQDGKIITLLVTNKHVIKGTIFTEFEVCKANKDNKPIDNETVSFHFNSSLWTPHPDPNVDLCCIPVSAIDEYRCLSDLGKKCFVSSLQLALIPTKEELNHLMALEEVIMVGYPHGFWDEYNHKPIIRRGITASHPNKDFSGKKETLLDIAMFPGSSGSPVFIVNPCFHMDNRNFLSRQKRVFFLGIAHEDCTKRENIYLSFFNTLKTIFCVKIKAHMNLALMIKSERILDFEKMIQNGEIRTSPEGNIGE